MISEVSSNVASIFAPKISKWDLPSINNGELQSPISFDEEDSAIVSAQAQLQYETEKFNSGAGNDVELAVASLVAKNTVQAEVNVIQTKKNMLDVILDMGE